MDTRPALLAHEVVLEVDPARVAAHAGAHAVVAHRPHAGTDAEAPANVGGHLGQCLPQAQATGALNMQREIAIAEPKPILPAERADAIHERPRLVTPAPASGGIIDISENIGQRVDIGRDAKSKMLEIIAGVGDNEQFVRRQDAAQTERQFRAADPARQRHDKSSAHRNKSSAAGRTSSDAVLSEPRHVRPRTTTTGWPSPPCPITSDAAAAISSACPVILT